MSTTIICSYQCITPVTKYDSALVANYKRHVTTVHILKEEKDKKDDNKLSEKKVLVVIRAKAEKSKKRERCQY